MGGLKLLRFLNAVQALREVDPNMTMTQLVTLLTVARDEGLSVAEIQRNAKLTRTTSSRIVRTLAGENEESTKGYCWLEMRTDPVDPRRRQVHVNEDGKELLGHVLKQLSGTADAK